MCIWAQCLWNNNVSIIHPRNLNGQLKQPMAAVVCHVHKKVFYVLVVDLFVNLRKKSTSWLMAAFYQELLSQFYLWRSFNFINTLNRGDICRMQKKFKCVRWFVFSHQCTKATSPRPQKNWRSRCSVVKIDRKW